MRTELLVLCWETARKIVWAIAVPCVGRSALKALVSPVTLMAFIRNGSSWLPSDCSPVSIRPTTGLHGSLAVFGFNVSATGPAGALAGGCGVAGLSKI